MAWISGVARFLKSPRGAWQAWRRSRAEARSLRDRQRKFEKAVAAGRPPSGERPKRVSDSEMAVCLFCGRTASVRPFAKVFQLDCSTCGACEVTVEAMGLLRADANLREAVLRQIRRHLDEGAERPLVNLEFIQSLRGRRPPRSAG